MAKKTFIVAHPKLHLAVEAEGKRKLVHVAKGTEYTCEEKHVESLVSQGKLVVATKKAVKAS